MLDQLPDDQIESIVAHELGHVANDDVLTGTLMGALGRGAGVAALGWLLVARRAAPPGGRGSPGDPRVVPLVLFLLAVGTLLPHRCRTWCPATSRPARTCTPST